MKQKLFTFLLLALVSPMAFGGGIVTNANLSAAYCRMPAQDATLGIDAVYYNPAGLAFMADGFYVSVNNQYIRQTRTISSTFPGMNRTEFEGGVVAPVFPSLYLVLKKDKVAFSFGVNPIGGGGSAMFEKGLPSFEQNFAAIPAALSASNIPTSEYSFDSEFEGRSLMWGIQANGSYAVNDMISFSIGIRYIIAQNSYDGYYRNVMINPDVPANFPAAMQTAYAGNMVKATTFFNDMSVYLAAVSQQLLGTANSLQPIVGGGGGTVLLSDGTTVGLTPTQVATLQGTITTLGGNPSGMTIAQAQTFFSGASTSYSNNSAQMMRNSVGTRDSEVDVKQSGNGIAPIIGINVKVNEKLNIGFRYEHRAELTVKNKTKKDDVRMYPDGAKYPNDMPTTLSLGASYKATEKLSLSAGAHYYFDKTAAYGKVKSRDASGIPTFYDNDDVIDNNFLELAFGAEYTVNDKILVSGGYLRTQSGVNLKYQSDLSHSLSTNTIGFGGRYMVTENIGLNLGAMMSFYLKETKNFDVPTLYDETYKRRATVLALGLDFKF